MRQTLLRIWLDRPWAGWTTDAGEFPLLGACWVWLILGGVYFAVQAIRRDREALRDPMTWLTWSVVLVLLSLAPAIGRFPPWIPIYGYGAMVLVGFTSALWFARARAKTIGLNPDLILDSAFWLLLCGMIGGRTAYLVQYSHVVYRDVENIPQALFATINLTEGGLVVIGALVGGGLGAYAFCRRRGILFLEFADLIIPAVFIGMMFGRIGCLLNGCCFGDACDLPWAITFPRGSVTFEILEHRGFVDPAAAATIPLHPTQIYAAINNLILALVTGTYFWYRRTAGDVFALGLILYPITRILLEFLRADEMGQLGTSLTISQIYSLIILTCGITLLITNRRRDKRTSTSVSVANPVTT